MYPCVCPIDQHWSLWQRDQHSLDLCFYFCSSALHGMSKQTFCCGRLCSSLGLVPRQNRCHPEGNDNDESERDVSLHVQGDDQLRTEETISCEEVDVENVPGTEQGPLRRGTESFPPPRTDVNTDSTSTPAAPTISLTPTDSSAYILGNFDSPQSLDEDIQTKCFQQDQHHSGQKCSHMPPRSSTGRRGSFTSRLSKHTSTLTIDGRKSALISWFQVSDNKMALTFFGSKREIEQEQERQQQSSTWVIHPCSTFR